jgi:CBS domain containing-hemolysin-like protein
MKPLIHVMKLSSNALLWVFGQRDLAHSGESHFTMTVDEIRMILSASEKDGTLEPEETQMIRGVFDLDERTVRDAMVPRTQIYGLSSDQTLADALRMFRDVPHARFPVYHESIDHIVGIVAIKELLGVMAESSGQTLEEVSRRPVLEFVNEPFIVPNSKPLSEMLKEFKRARQQMAIVIDEYGGTEGIITLEDILEEIVGDYEDEFTRQARRVRKLVGSQYEVDASMRVSDLEELVGYPFPVSDDYVTLAGLFYKHFGSVPAVGDSVMIEGARLTVLEMDSHRITLVKFEDTAVGEDGVVRLADTSSAPDAVPTAPVEPTRPVPADGADGVAVSM